MKKEAFMASVRCKIGFFLFILSKPIKRLFPITVEVILCECKSSFQLASYRFNEIKDNFMDFKPVYKRYTCGDCGKIRYYKEQRLRNKPGKRRK